MRPFLIGLLIVCVGWLGCGSPSTETSASPSEEKTPAEPASPQPTSPSDKQTILFFGNSLTAGYGVEPEQGFPALIQEKIDSLGLPYQVINAGISGETTTGGKNRLAWALRQKVAVFVLELGANDGLRGIPTASTRQNLQDMLDQVRETYPDCEILFTGMMVPPNMGEAYTQEFQAMFPSLAKENTERVTFLPFLLEGVAGEPQLNQADGIHPTPEGHQIVADHVWEALAPLLKRQAEGA
jgi:acyl-CoA thioesterase-1